MFAFHNCLDALVLCLRAFHNCLLASVLCLRASHNYLLPSRLLGNLPLHKQFARQVACAQAISKAICLCTRKITGNLLVHRQSRRQLARAQAKWQGKAEGNQYAENPCHMHTPFVFSGKGNVWPWSPQPIPFLRGARSVHGHGDIPFSFPDLTGESVVMATTTHVLSKKEAGEI